MRYYYIALLFTLFLGSCIKDDKPKIVHRSSEVSETLPLIEDSTNIKMADLPVHIDSTSYLLHPIGDFKIKNERGKIIFKSSGYGGGNNFSISSSRSYSISGDLSNIMFQHISSEELKSLTNKTIKIQSASFLWEIYNKTKQEILVYEINDLDTNQDKKLDRNDIKALYLSLIDGSGFKKLTVNNHELINWKVIPNTNRLYFKTIDDTNRDGNFDEKDTVHYKYVDLSTDKFEIIEYFPI